MPLTPLANTIVRLSQQHGTTPVIVMPGYLELRHEFFLALANTLQSTTERAVRVDWCTSETFAGRLLGNSLAGFRARWLNRTLVNSGTENLRVQLTATIARPGGLERDLVIGLCDQSHELPPWTTAIRIGP